MASLRNFLATVARKIGITPDEPHQVHPELFQNYLLRLQSRWLLLGKPQSDIDADPILKKIQTLLAGCETPKPNWDTNWQSAWQAEQLMSQYLQEADVIVECELRLFEAEKLKLASHPHFVEKWKGAAATENKDVRVSLQRSLYGNLLDDLQWLYSKRKLDRNARSRMARNVRQIAFGLLLAVIFPFIPWTNGESLGVKLFGTGTNGTHFYGLYTAATFGLLGALFSRLIFIQNNFSALDYDDVIDEFQNRVFAIRLLVGMVGALIVFYGILGNVLSGDLFPDLEVLKLAPPENFDKDFCKLVIWCFLGGFSQTLVPDFLTRTESSASKTN